MVAALTRTADIIDRVSSLYRRGKPERQFVDLNEVVREMSVLLADKATRSAVSIRTDLDPVLPASTADRVQLQQVLMNLMLNGVEAMQDKGGELTVASKSTEDGQLLISVSDTGIGFSSDAASAFSTRSSPRNHKAPVWDCPSAADHRGAWRPFVGELHHGTGGDLSVHTARRGDGILSGEHLAQGRSSKRLAEEFRALQAIPPRQFDRLGNADPHARDDLRLCRRAHTARSAARRAAGRYARW